MGDSLQIIITVVEDCSEDQNKAEPNSGTNIVDGDSERFSPIYLAFLSLALTLLALFSKSFVVAVSVLPIYASLLPHPLGFLDDRQHVDQRLGIVVDTESRGCARKLPTFHDRMHGKKATKGLQSAGELQPEFLPNRFYTCAVERNSTGYTMEASGYFARPGFRTFRFFRPFIVDNVPIWHYNVKASEYGRYNRDHGSQTWSNEWPAGSAYPDRRIRITS
jgi:hypothetical protein